MSEHGKPFLSCTTERNSCVCNSAQEGGVLNLPLAPATDLESRKCLNYIIIIRDWASDSFQSFLLVPRPNMNKYRDEPRYLSFMTFLGYQ